MVDTPKFLRPDEITNTTFNDRFIDARVTRQALEHALAHPGVPIVYTTDAGNTLALLCHYVQEVEFVDVLINPER